MTTRIRRRLAAGRSILLALFAVVALGVAACGGAAAQAEGIPSVAPDSAVPIEVTPAAPTGSDDLLDELEAASEELEDFLDTDGDGLDDMAVAPDNGFSPSLYVDADDLGRILGEIPEPQCTHSQLFDGAACTWSTGDASASLTVELYRDPNLATFEAYVGHMELIMGDGSPIDDLGQAAFSGPNPFGPGARVTVFIGDGLHLWVSIAKDGDGAQIADAALELASRIVAMHDS